jgi:hypothetical protein
MFTLFEIINEIVNDVVIGKIADLVVSVIEKVDAIVHLKKTLGDELNNFSARQITLDELKGVNSNE